MSEYIGGLSEDDIQFAFETFQNIDEPSELVKALHETPQLKAPVFHAMLRQQVLEVKCDDSVPEDIKDYLDVKFNLFFMMVHYDYYTSKYELPAKPAGPPKEIEAENLAELITQAISDKEVTLATLCCLQRMGLANVVRECLPALPELSRISNHDLVALLDRCDAMDNKRVNTKLRCIRRLAEAHRQELSHREEPCISSAITWVCTKCGSTFADLHRCYLDISKSTSLFSLVSQNRLNLHICPSCGNDVVIAYRLLATELPKQPDLLLSAGLVCVPHPSARIVMPPPPTSRDSEMDRVLEVRLAMLEECAKASLLEPAEEDNAQVVTIHFAYTRTELVDAINRAMQLSSLGSESAEEVLAQETSEKFITEIVGKVTRGELPLDMALEQVRKIVRMHPDAFGCVVPSIVDFGEDAEHQHIAMAIAEGIFEAKGLDSGPMVLLAVQSANSHLLCGNIGLALAAAERADRYLAKLPASDDTYDTAQAVLHNLRGKIHQLQGNIDQAIRCFRCAVEYYDQILSKVERLDDLGGVEMRVNRLNTLNSIGLCSEEEGDLSSAFDAFTSVKEAADQILHIIDDAWASQRNVEPEYQRQLHRKVRYLISGVTANKGLVLARCTRIGQVFISQCERLGRGGSGVPLRVLQEVLYKEESSDEDPLHQYVTLWKRLEVEPDTTTTLQFQEHLRALVLQHYKAALDVSKSIDGHPFAAIQCANLGSFLLAHTDNQEDGIRYLEEAVDHAQRLPGCRELPSFLEVLSSALEERGDVQRAADCLAESIKHTLHLMVSAGIKSLQGLLGHDLCNKASHFALLQQAREHGLQVIEVFEQTKSNLLAIELARSAPDIRALVGNDEDGERLEMLERERERLFLKVSQAPDLLHHTVVPIGHATKTLSSSDPAKSYVRLQELEMLIAQLREGLTLRHPRFEFWCRYSTLGDFKIKDLQKLSDNDHPVPVVGVFLADDALWSYAIFAGNVRVNHAALDTDARLQLDKSITELSVELAAGTSLSKAARDTLETIASEVWKPFEGLMKTLPQGAELVLSLHDFLHSFPWALLPTQDGPLVSRFVIHQVFSLPILENLALRKSTKSGEGALVVCDPLEGSEMSLPGTIKEAQAICRIFERCGQAARLLRGADATRSRVAEESKGKQVVHFACHGSFERVTLEGGELFLAPSAGETSDSGILTPSKIIEHFDLEAVNLINLAACETGQVRSEKGTDVSGLTRAFLCVGAQSIIASLWPIGDEEAATFSTLFYENYLELGDPGVALHRTQIACMQGRAGVTMSLPCNWASYVLLGAPRSLRRGPD